MILDFLKMSGAGNDFILVDNRAQRIHLTTEQIVKLCHRQLGIGADGIMLLIPSPSERAEWAWQFYNNDGSHAEMCGNGARCFARFIQKLTGVTGKTSFETGAGVISAEFDGERVTVNLTKPSELRLNERVLVDGEQMTIHSLNTGVPHAVLFVLDADQAMVQKLGSTIRYHSNFAPKGTNVNFVQELGPNFIRVRTYERGVEGETLACGTGVTASALIASKVHQFTSPVKIQVQSGDTLEVSFTEKNGEFDNVCLNGPADFVYEGRIQI